MGKPKKCSFCSKEVPKLYYSSPACCHNWSCQSEYQKTKSKSSAQKIKNKKTNQFSASLLSNLKEYRELRDAYLKNKPICEIKSPVCTGYTTELHHTKPRAHYLCDVRVFKACCRACNDYVEREHSWAEERGFKQRHSGETSKPILYKRNGNK